MGISRTAIGRRRVVSFLGIEDGNVARRKEMEEWTKMKKKKESTVDLRFVGAAEAEEGYEYVWSRKSR